MNKKLARKITRNSHDAVHLIFIGTKPDIIKQAPLYHELLKQSKLVVVCHTGQHYDFNNSKAILDELDIKVDINFKIRGNINEKFGQIVQQTGMLISKLKKSGKTIVSYVHGDTLTACGAALGSVFQRVAPVHVEAGLRTMTPKAVIYEKHISALKNGRFNFSDYLKDLKDIKNYIIGSFEPFPEQIDTRMIDVVSAIRLAPTKINYQNLVSERNLESGTVIVGNTISDAVNSALKKPFYDKKLQKLGSPDFIFFTIHRRETCEDSKRFKIILDILQKILDNDHSVLLIMHPMFKHGIKLSGEDIFRNIKKKYGEKLTVLSPISNHSDTLKIINKSKLVVTDSGGLQEETNILGKRCVTMRYGTDRIESVIYGNNFLAPLYNSAFAIEIIEGALRTNPKKQNSLYGNKVSEKIVNHVLDHIDDNTGLFRTEEQRLNLSCK